MKNNNLKNVIVILIITMISNSIHAQDLIITNEGDSINCKITKIKPDYIYFTFKHKDEIRSTLLPVGKVMFQYNYYETSEVPADKIAIKEAYPHFRASLNGGWSYRVARVGDNLSAKLEEYIKELKSGYHYGMDVSYYFSEQLGIGFKYYNYRSKNEISNVYLAVPNGYFQYDKMSDDISINFIGPFVSTRLLNANKRNSFLLNLGIGFMGYTDKAVLNSSFKIKGSTVGLCWDIGYDIGISENFALGFQLSYMMGTLTKLEISEGTQTETIRLEKENYEGLSRIDLSIGLRFIK